MPSDQNIESGCLKRAVGNSFQSLHFMMDLMEISYDHIDIASHSMHHNKSIMPMDNAIHTIMCMIFFYMNSMATLFINFENIWKCHIDRN